MKTKATKWECPKCKAPSHKHGKGGAAGCMNQGEKTCEGLICDCADRLSSLKDHGTTQANPCSEANCYHCGWGGTVPEPAVIVANLKGWARTAWKAGWRPPGSR